MNLFTPPAPTKEQRVAAQIDTSLRNAAIALRNSYNQIRALIYTNPSFKDEYGVVDSNAIYAAFAANTTTGLSVQELAEAAILVKTIVNRFATDTIVDPVPEATITMP